VPPPLSTEEAAVALGITRQWLGHLVRTGQLRAMRGKRRRYLFDPKDIASFKKTYPSDDHPQPVKGATA